MKQSGLFHGTRFAGHSEYCLYNEVVKLTSANNNCGLLRTYVYRPKYSKYIMYVHIVPTVHILHT